MCDPTLAVLSRVSATYGRGQIILHRLLFQQKTCKCCAAQPSRIRCCHYGRKLLVLFARLAYVVVTLEQLGTAEFV